MEGNTKHKGRQHKGRSKKEKRRHSQARQGAPSTTKHKALLRPDTRTGTLQLEATRCAIGHDAGLRTEHPWV
eukprot:315235-Pelagomonas_calceolata.AAC.3